MLDPIMSRFTRPIVRSITSSITRPIVGGGQSLFSLNPLMLWYQGIGEAYVITTTSLAGGDGTDQYRTPALNYQRDDGPVIIHGWFKLPDTAARTSLSKFTDGTNFWELYYENNLVKFENNNGWDSHNGIIEGTQTALPGWHHLLIYLNAGGTNNKPHVLFFDGQFAESSNKSIAGPVNSTPVWFENYVDVAHFGAFVATDVTLDYDVTTITEAIEPIASALYDLGPVDDAADLPSGLNALPSGWQFIKGYDANAIVDLNTGASMTSVGSPTLEGDYGPPPAQVPASATDPIIRLVDSGSEQINFDQESIDLRPTLNADGSIAFDGSDDKFEITPFPSSGTFNGTMVVGTSLGTFAYDVTYGAGDLSEIELLGEAAGYPQDGNLVAFGLFPQLTNAQVNFVRGQFIALGAADGTTEDNLSNYWRNKPITTWYGLLNNDIRFLSRAWANCGLTEWTTVIPNTVEAINQTWETNNLNEWTIELPDTITTCFKAFRTNNFIDWNIALPSLSRDFAECWRNCSILTNWAANLFDDWNPSLIQSGVFNLTWDGCNLTSQSVENILVSIETSGQHATSNGTSGGTALGDPVIDIEYDGSGLTPATTAAIASLESKGWTVNITS